MPETPGSPAVLSPLDEARFGIRTARAMDLTESAIGQVLDFCRLEQVRLLIARCPTRDLPAAQAMERNGFNLMDTLVYFRRDLVKQPLLESVGIPIRLAIVEDVDAVGEIARQAFRGYPGHYHADPRLDRSACDDLYVDWARRSCSEPEAADVMLIAEQDGVPVGFLTLKCLDQETADGRLYAVLPQTQGRGIGKGLLVEGMHWCREHGLLGMVISTQITNLASQVSWARVGFIPHESFYTFHKWFEEDNR